MSPGMFHWCCCGGDTSDVIITAFDSVTRHIVMFSYFGGGQLFDYDPLGFQPQGGVHCPIAIFNHPTLGEIIAIGFVYNNDIGLALIHDAFPGQYYEMAGRTDCKRLGNNIIALPDGRLVSLFDNDSSSMANIELFSIEPTWEMKSSGKSESGIYRQSIARNNNQDIYFSYSFPSAPYSTNLHIGKFTSSSNYNSFTKIWGGDMPVAIKSNIAFDSEGNIILAIKISSLDYYTLYKINSTGATTTKSIPCGSGEIYNMVLICDANDNVNVVISTSTPNPGLSYFLTDSSFELITSESIVDELGYPTIIGNEFGYPTIGIDSSGKLVLAYINSDKQIVLYVRENFWRLAATSSYENDLGASRGFCYMAIRGGRTLNQGGT